MPLYALVVNTNLIVRTKHGLPFVKGQEVVVVGVDVVETRYAFLKGAQAWWQVLNKKC